MHIIKNTDTEIDELFVKSGGVYQYTHDVLEADYTNFNYEVFVELLKKHFGIE